MTPVPRNRSLPLASAQARRSRRQIERWIEEARYGIGIDLGTTNSSVAIVDVSGAVWEGSPRER
jgi:molecular chaperone DnaK (HSP70)